MNPQDGSLGSIFLRCMLARVSSGIAATDRQIDALVYELSGLMKGEIKNDMRILYCMLMIGSNIRTPKR